MEVSREANQWRDGLRAARAGDHHSLAALFAQVKPELLARIRTLMGPRARACAESQDFLQDVFGVLIVELPRFREGGRAEFVRWATEIAQRRILSQLRRRRPDPIADPPEAAAWPARPNPPSPSSAAGRLERTATLWKAMQQLGEEQHEVIRLRQFQGLSFEEIGGRLQRTANAAQLLHQRAMLRLGRILETLDGCR